MAVSRTARCCAAVARRFLKPSVVSPSNAILALTHSARFVCTPEADRRCTSSGLPTGVCADTFEACPVCSSSKGNCASSNLKRSGGTATGMGRPQRGTKVHLFSKSAQQLTPAQLTHFSHLGGLLQRLSCLRWPSSNAVQMASKAAEAYPLLSQEGEGASQPPQTWTSTECGHALHNELFVASRVIASPYHHALPAETDTVACCDEAFTGVNHAFHKRVNPAGATLQGILKGCAEQNALGAAAASGCIYADVADVFLLAARSSPMTSSRHVQELGKRITAPVPAICSSCATACRKAGPHAAQADAIFPCPECWRHLCHVARARLQQERPPLRLFVYAASPAATVHLFSVAQQRMKTMEAPMDVCIVSG
ncbi:hypothetical protein Q4I32_005715 [Leishmania shawi]|uniref:Uncharacterized protein n=1 Tax=Leishmania shawi TaxID=5680 RepID=A0AAW3BID9_9TRYP